MNYHYLLKKIISMVSQRASQGNNQNVWAFIKKAAIGIAVLVVLVVIALIIGLFFLAQFLLSFVETVPDPQPLINTIQEINIQDIVSTSSIESHIQNIEGILGN